MAIGIVGALIASAIASLVTGAAGAVTSGITSAQANATNEKNVANTNATNLEIAQMTNEFNAAEAQKARDWQTEMSNTEVQRRMADFESAGLNPLLAASYGTGTVAGNNAASGVSTTAHAAKVAPIQVDFSGLSSAFSSMTNMMLVSKMLQGKYGDGILGLKSKYKLTPFEEL